MRKSLIGRMAMVLGLGAAMSASGFKKSDVPMPTEIDHVDSGSSFAHTGTVYYFNHNKHHPKKAKAWWRNKYHGLDSRSVAFLDTATVPPVPVLNKFDNGDDARRKRRERREINHANRHERRRNGIQYA
jgi:hypothetical protein